MTVGRSCSSRHCCAPPRSRRICVTTGTATGVSIERYIRVVPGDVAPDAVIEEEDCERVRLESRRTDQGLP